MSSEPEDHLERLFAAEESAIRDDGFTARVIEQARPVGRWRRPAIYGAGLLGAGFAFGGISEMAPHLRLTEWFLDVTSSATNAVASVDLTHAAQGLPDSVLLGVAALIAGVSFLIAAATVQSR